MGKRYVPSSPFGVPGPKKRVVKRKPVDPRAEATAAARAHHAGAQKAKADKDSQAELDFTLKQIKRKTPGVAGANAPGIPSLPDRPSRDVQTLRRGVADTSRDKRKKKKTLLQRVVDTAVGVGSDAGGVVKRSVRKVYGGGPHTASSGKGGLASAQAKGVSGGLPFRVAKNTGAAIADDPKKQLGRIPGDLLKSAASAPAGIAKLVTDPVGGAKMIAGDYARRYSGTDAEMRARLKKEGVTPELLDVAGVALGGAGGAGRAVQGAAEAGKLGAKAEKIATVRPALRVSGGEAVKQEVSPNFIRNVARANVDRRRAAVQAKRVQRAERAHDVKEGPGVDAVRKAAQEAGQVTHIRKRKQKQAQHRIPARDKGVALARQKAEGQREERGALKSGAKLSRDEKLAFGYAMDYGIPADPVKAREVLKTYRARAVRERGDMDVPKRQDELPKIDHLIANADRAFTENLRNVVAVERKRSERVVGGDPGVGGEQAQIRRYQPLADLLNVKRADGETTGSWLRRVKKAQVAAGLERPGYFKAEKRPRSVFASRAVGGTRAVAEDGAYKGDLARTGRVRRDYETHVRSVAQNVKRKYNWNLVADHVDRHSFDWGKDKSVNELLDEIDRRKIDPRSVALWNPRKFRELQAAAGDSAGFDADPTFEHGDVATAAAESSGTIAEIRARFATSPEEFKNSGWTVIPHEVYAEIHADLKPSGPVARSYDIAKGKASRVLLANPAWLQFQIGSNAMLTGLAGVGPVNAVKAQVWWRKLSQEERDAVEPYIGVHKFYDEQRHLGASANNKIVNAYRALKTTGLYQAGHKANPFDALFRADNAQNNFFRKAVFYNSVKRETYKRMGENGKQAMALQQRIVDTLSLKSPDEAMRALVRDRDLIERHAKTVTDFLGDWTTYTAKERRGLSRAVMFYGFIRFSTKLTFYTLPVEHPLMADMLLQLGRLEHDELKKIFGVDVPPWEIGNLYSKDGKRMFEARRLNPFFNALQYQSPGSLAGLIPPAGQLLLNQATHSQVGFDKLYTIDGKTAYPKGKDIPLGDRLQILLAEALKLSPYYRAAEKTGIPGVVKPLRGKQGSDSSLVFPQPIEYKQGSAIRKNEDLKRRQDKAIVPSLTEEFAPAFGAEGETRIESARSHAKDQGKAPKTTGAVPRPPSGGPSVSRGKVPPPPSSKRRKLKLRVPPPPK